MAMITTKKDSKIQPVRPGDFIKDPYVLDFLGLDEDRRHQEKDIEQAILNQLQVFLLELGRGFTFVSRLQHKKDSFILGLHEPF